MKVKEKQLEDGAIRLSITATAQEVDRALDRAQGAIASRFGLRPDPERTVADALAEHLGVNDVDSILQSQAMNMLVPFALDQRGITPLAQPKIQPAPGFKRGHASPSRSTSFPSPVSPSARMIPWRSPCRHSNPSTSMSTRRYAQT